jgi:hypothetical protein
MYTKKARRAWQEQRCSFPGQPTNQRLAMHPNADVIRDTHGHGHRTWCWE